jgi:proteasome lid subunit RPN8/RPN11
MKSKTEKNITENKCLRRRNLKERLLKKLKSFFFGEYRIRRIVIKSDVIKTIMEFAKHNHPKEFVAFLGGKMRNDSLEIDKLLYQRFYSSSDSAYFRIEIPINEKFFGTVHNHPNNSNTPSSEDSFLFGKYGLIHLIISYPYSQEDIAGYDFKGHRIYFEIKDKKIKSKNKENI